VVQPVRGLQVREPLGVLYHRETHVLHLQTTVLSLFPFKHSKDNYGLTEIDLERDILPFHTLRYLLNNYRTYFLSQGNTCPFTCKQQTSISFFSSFHMTIMD
jgi:hypothetical protein